MFELHSNSLNSLSHKRVSIHHLFLIYRLNDRTYCTLYPYFATNLREGKTLDSKPYVALAKQILCSQRNDCGVQNDTLVSTAIDVIDCRFSCFLSSIKLPSQIVASQSEYSTDAYIYSAYIQIVSKQTAYQTFLTDHTRLHPAAFSYIFLLL